MIGHVEDIVQWLFSQDRDKVFEIKEHKEKRSLTANSYFHKLCSLIAEVNHTSNIEVKNALIREQELHQERCKEQGRLQQ